MHRQRSLLTGLQRCVRFASTQLRAPAPAICAVQIAPKHERRGEVEDWLREGRDILQATLHSHRPPVAVNASAYIVGSDVRSCFHWVHIPAASQDHPDTVAIIFTNDNDLSLWRQSPRRNTWLESGVERGLALNDDSMLIDAEKITLQKDDGSLGGWLPSSDDAGEDGRRDLMAPPPTWKVAATVLIAMYPVQELNRILLLPLLASSPHWSALSPTVQVFAACAWTCGAVTVVLLPHARSLSERVGFIGGHRGCPDPAALARASGSLLLVYGGLVVVGLGVSAAVGPVRPRGVWSSLVPERPDKAD